MLITQQIYKFSLIECSKRKRSQVNGNKSSVHNEIPPSSFKITPPDT